MAETTEGSRFSDLQRWRYGENTMEPLGPIGIISKQLEPAFADNLNRALRKKRQINVENFPELAEFPGYSRNDYRIDVDLGRFNSGEGKATLLKTVRGHDLYIVTDILNRGTFINRFNNYHPLSPDEHYQDLVRMISATHGIARRVNVIMPYLYQGRRFARDNRSSMDCSLMLKELFRLGVNNFVTLDAHDGRVANAVPYQNFETFPTSLQLIEGMLIKYPDLSLDPKHFIVASPKETGVSRAVYFASLMKVPMGTFYRRYRGLSFHGAAVGKSVSKDDIMFLGENLEGKDVLLVDDMIDTGASVARCAEILKQKGARRIFIAASFAQFSRGFEQMSQYHDAGIVEHVFATNLSYRPPELCAMPWFTSVDLTPYVASIINTMNHDGSLSKLISPTERIVQLLAKHRQAHEE